MEQKKPFKTTWLWCMRICRYMDISRFYKNYGLSILSTKNICDSETLHYIYSITKTFTSALTLTLCEKNILALEDKIDYHLTELFTESYTGEKDLNLYINRNATIKQLLNHTSGIYDFEKNSKEMISNADTIGKWGYELYSNQGNAISQVIRNQLYKSIIDVNADKSEFYGYGIRKFFYDEFEFTWLFECVKS